jgi:hypothetical protein
MTIAGSEPAFRAVDRMRGKYYKLVQSATISNLSTVFKHAGQFSSMALPVAKC